MNRGKNSINKTDRDVVTARYKGKCIKCGSKKNLEYHHWIPVSKGGDDSPDNIVLLCRECHTSLHLAREVHEIEKRRRTGRKTLITYEAAEPIFWDYYNEIIGAKEAKKRLGYSDKSHIPDIPLFKRFLKDNHLEKKTNHIDIWASAIARRERKKQKEIERWREIMP